MYNKSLNNDDIVTLLAEVQARVNNHPLTYVSEDPNNLLPLAPSHLLYARRLDLMPPLTMTEEDDPPYNDLKQLNCSYSHLSKVINKFMVMWQREYLIALRGIIMLLHSKSLYQYKSKILFL